MLKFIYAKYCCICLPFILNNHRQQGEINSLMDLSKQDSEKIRERRFMNGLGN